MTFKNIFAKIKLPLILIAVNLLWADASCQNSQSFKIGMGSNYRQHLGYDFMVSANLKVAKSFNIDNSFFIGTYFIKPVHYISEKWSNPVLLAEYTRDSIIINRFFFVNYSPSYRLLIKSFNLFLGPSFTLRTQSRGGGFSRNTGNQESYFPSYSGYNYGFPGIRRFSAGIQAGFDVKLNKRILFGMNAFIEPGNIVKSDIYGTQRSGSGRLSFLLKYQLKKGDKQ